MLATELFRADTGCALLGGVSVIPGAGGGAGGVSVMPASAEGASISANTTAMLSFRSLIMVFS